MLKIFENTCRLLVLAVWCSAVGVHAQELKSEDTEVYQPVPKNVFPAEKPGMPPSDAIILFDGKNLDEWHSEQGTQLPADWKVKNGIMTVNKAAGGIITRQVFTDYQMHIEWRIPETISGEGQSRGNSGIFLANTGAGDQGYEIQILDSYRHSTYVNGQASSVYKQGIPLVNASKKSGEWQVYDIVWRAPRFNENGTLSESAYVTVFHNGVLVQNHFKLLGETVYSGFPVYRKHGPSPIKLQAHGDPSEPISFRNIWVRRLD